MCWIFKRNWRSHPQNHCCRSVIMTSTEDSPPERQWQAPTHAIWSWINLSKETMNRCPLWELLFPSIVLSTVSEGSSEPNPLLESCMSVRQRCPPVPCTIWTCRTWDIHLSTISATHPQTPTMPEASVSFLWSPDSAQASLPLVSNHYLKIAAFFHFIILSVTFIHYGKHLEHTISTMVICISFILAECWKKMKFTSSIVVLPSMSSWTSCSFLGPNPDLLHLRLCASANVPHNPDACQYLQST